MTLGAEERPLLGAIIVAAGSGARFGSPDKVFALLAGKPVLEYSLRLFGSEPAVSAVVLVAGAHTYQQSVQLVAALRMSDVTVCTGGETRSASVRAGLAALDPEVGWVAVHDAARPLVSAELFRRVFAAARRTGAAVPCLPLSDTVVTVDADGNVASAPERGTLRAVQTPQVARRDWLEHAFAEFRDGTDEGSLLVRAGYPVATVDGDASNIKLTRPFDLELAELLLSQRATTA